MQEMGLGARLYFKGLFLACQMKRECVVTDSGQSPECETDDIGDKPVLGARSKEL